RESLSPGDPETLVPARRYLLPARHILRSRHRSTDLDLHPHPRRRNRKEDGSLQRLPQPRLAEGLCRCRLRRRSGLRLADPRAVPRRLRGVVDRGPQAGVSEWPCLPVSDTLQQGEPNRGRRAMSDTLAWLEKNQEGIVRNL